MTNELTIREANPTDFKNVYEWLFFPDYDEGNDIFMVPENIN